MFSPLTEKVQHSNHVIFRISAVFQPGKGKKKRSEHVLQGGKGMLPPLLHKEGTQTNSVGIFRQAHVWDENVGTFSFFLSSGISIILLLIGRGQNENEFLAFLLHLIH